MSARRWSARFLRLFEQHGLAVEKQVAIGLDADGPAISTADFVVPETRVAIYIDGPRSTVGTDCGGTG
jgi:hypothetical protein